MIAKTLKWVAIGCLVLFVAGFVFVSLWPILYRGTTEHDMAYDKFVSSEFYSGRIKLPDNAEHIEFFFWSSFDTNYRFVQANVDLQEDFSDYVQGAAPKDVKIESQAHNARFSLERFDSVFDQRHRPQWWDEESMQSFDQNCLFAWKTKEYGQGLWYFYNEKDHILRVFQWSQQHLSYFVP